ncbi:MAG TPA: IPT/TIG domain-containing protein [Solirubrobacteraceae bacterium]|nr:IPT/TIG domain-containing protein [Solirubrobacteraceae bacterium]
MATRWLALAAMLCVLLWLGLTQGVRLLAGRGSTVLAPGASTESLASLSPVARASISASLGAEDPAYRFDAAGPEEFSAANSSQQLGVAANASGVTLHAHGLTLGLSVGAIGYDGTWRAVGRARVSANANRLMYASQGLRSWYVNGPLGVEQGFTVVRPSGVASGSALTLAISVSGDARASLAADRQSVRFVSAGGRALRYGGLTVTDASGRTLPSSLALSDGRLLLRANTRDARFPLHVDPIVEVPEQKLSTSGEEGERAGLSVALSGDGNTAVVGAPDGEVSGGAVWVFTRNSPKEPFASSGTELSIPGAEPTPPCKEGEEVTAEGNECAFGHSVAVSADGDTVLVGAPEQEEGRGAAWVFTRTESGWQRTQLVNPNPNAHVGRFGRGVSLSADGRTALIGAPVEDNSHGRAWVFTLEGSTWTAQAALEAEGEQGEARLGVSVALSGNGEVALLGAPANKHFVGAAWVFKRERPGSERWDQASELTGAGETGSARFGYSVAISGEGNTALIGAPLDEATSGVMTGAAWVFAETEGKWAEQGPMLTGADAKGVPPSKGEEFGYGVAFSEEGNDAIVGAPLADGGRGAAWLYARSGTSWEEVRELKVRGTSGAREEHKARFGKSVALSANAETLLVGGPAETGDEGTAWVFGGGPAVTSVTPQEGEEAGGTKVEIKGQNLIGTKRVLFGGTEASFKVITTGEEPDIKTEIQAVSPPGKGHVQITVETLFGMSEVFEPVTEFTYIHKQVGGSGPGEGKGTGKRSETPSPPETTTNTTTGGTSGGTPQGAVQVLALGPVSGGACGASLTGSKIAVRARTALVKIRRTGAGGCRGHVTLSVKVKMAGKGKHAKSKLKAIGTANFTLSSASTLLVQVKLNAAGRALLKAAHGRLNAHVLVFKSAPAPTQAHTSTVRLVRQAPAKRKAKPEST